MSAGSGTAPNSSSSATWPQLVIAGAARSGTSALAALLSAHPLIDPGRVKEPNYFSRRFDRGPGWYDGLYRPPRPGLLRLDASVSYTSPLYPEALDRLAQAAPSALVVYVVRDPTMRALSHYLYRHIYFQIEPAPTFGAALRASSYYTDGSDYSRWIPALSSRFPALLVVPFELVTGQCHAVASVVCQRLSLPPPPVVDQRTRVHRNDVVAFRSGASRRASSRLRRSAWYPRVRAAVGASRMRRLRGLVTSAQSLPTLDDALASCDPAQREELSELRTRAGLAVRQHLTEQDAELGLSWRGRSFAASEG